MKIIAQCVCGFIWSKSNGARQVKVAMVTPHYVTLCKGCGKVPKQKIIIAQENNDVGTFEITSTGDKSGEMML